MIQDIKLHIQDTSYFEINILQTTKQGLESHGIFCNYHAPSVVTGHCNEMELHKLAPISYTYLIIGTVEC
jgi:hypothetical protein